MVVGLLVVVLGVVVGLAAGGVQSRSATGLIAFTRLVGGVGQAYAIGEDGSDLRRLTATTAGRGRAGGVVLAGFTSWSPDGRRIAFTEATKTGLAVLVANPDGSGRRRVAFTKGDVSILTASWSPRGSQLAFDVVCAKATGEVCTGRPLGGGVFLVGSDGRGLHRLAGSSDWFPNWSPDGKKLLFERWERADGFYYALYVIGADGHGLRRLARVSAEIATTGHWARWSPDGSKIAAVEEGTPIVMNADGGNRRTGPFEIWSNPLTLAGEDGPIWSPDGRSIAFVNREDGHTSIGVVAGDGHLQPRLTQSINSEWPAWSPDGHKIAFAGWQRGSTKTSIYLMNTDGSEQTELTHGSTDFAPTWQPSPN